MKYILITGLLLLSACSAVYNNPRPNFVASSHSPTQEPPSLFSSEQTICLYVEKIARGAMEDRLNGVSIVSAMAKADGLKDPDMRNMAIAITSSAYVDPDLDSIDDFGDTMFLDCMKNWGK